MTGVLEFTSEKEEITKGLDRVGLVLDATEISELEQGQTIPIDRMSLGEIGAVFILAAAVAGTYTRGGKTKMSFGDLQNQASIALYCWEMPQIGTRSLCLMFSDGQPALTICNTPASMPQAA